MNSLENENNKLEHLSEQQEAMPKLSDEFVDAYKQSIEDEVRDRMPDIWDKIEAALPEKVGKQNLSSNALTSVENNNVVPIKQIEEVNSSKSGINQDKDSSGGRREKNNKKKSRNIYRYGLIVAACICGLILIPVIQLGRETKTQDAASAPQDTMKDDMYSAFSEESEGNGFHFEFMQDNAADAIEATESMDMSSSTAYDDAICEDAIYEDAEAEEGEISSGIETEGDEGILPLEGTIGNIQYTIEDSIGFYNGFRERGYIIDTLNQPDAPYYYYICSGEKPSGGYSIDIVDLELNEEENLLIITVEEHSPGIGAIVTDALTYPSCMVAIKPNVDQVIIIDVNGEEFPYID